MYYFAITQRVTLHISVFNIRGFYFLLNLKKNISFFPPDSVNQAKLWRTQHTESGIC